MAIHAELSAHDLYDHFFRAALSQKCLVANVEAFASLRNESGLASGYPPRQRVIPQASGESPLVAFCLMRFVIFLFIL